jgi:hypothetical protein
MTTAGVFNNMPPRISELLNTSNTRVAHETRGLQEGFDRRINELFSYFFPRIPDAQRQIPPTSSGCWVIQGHGDDQDIGSRKTILGAMLETYPYLADKEPELVDYINNHVKMCIAMGLPGPSAPMEGQQEGGEWDGYTSSEIDIQLVRRCFELFEVYVQDNDVTVNPTVLTILHTIIRHPLRANFEEIWGDYNGRSRPPLWMRPFYALMAIDEIWVQKMFVAKSTFFTRASTDRLLYLRDDDPELRVHEGIHLIDMRNNVGQLLLGLIKNPEGNGSVDIDIDNIAFPEVRQRLTDYFHILYPGIKRSEEAGHPELLAFNAILDKIQQRSEPFVMLSDIILLAYILKIDFLQLYDPTCRPVADEKEEIRLETRSGTNYGKSMTPKQWYSQETYPSAPPPAGGKKKNVKSVKRKNKKTYTRKRKNKV